MALPAPEPGLVIGYAYLWRREAREGQDEGRKDRRCVIVLAVQQLADATVVTVAPITHMPPLRPEEAMELSASTKARLGLDRERSWIVATELNRFVWPGVDLRPVSRGGDVFAYGRLPLNMFADLRIRIAAMARVCRIRVTNRDS